MGDRGRRYIGHFLCLSVHIVDGFDPADSLGLTILQLGLTLITYPAVVFVSYILFGEPPSGEVDALGHRI
jgi:hypothetical protein